MEHKALFRSKKAERAVSHRICPTVFAATLSLAIAASAFAQTPAPAGVNLGQRAPAASGTVTGHVYCTDTQRPARFADVEVLSEVQPAGGSSTAASTAPSYQPVARGRTALDGSFAVTGVQPGDYFVIATQTGYINPVSVSRTAQKPITGAPKVHVEANRSSDAMVSIDRGAVVGGRVIYDDGSPVAGVAVRLRPVTGADVNGRFGNGFGFGQGDTGTGITDDRGVFRVSGVAAGKYILVTTVQTETTGGGGFGGRGGGGGRGGFSPPISVYAPNTQHRTEARTFDIRGGETLDGADVVVALAGLHSVKGSVESKADAHLLNSGTVTLTDASDTSFSRTGIVSADGTFFLEYLPPGNYNLSVTGADRSGNGRRDDTTTVSYQSATTSLVLGDHDLAVDPVTLAVATAGK